MKVKRVVVQECDIAIFGARLLYRAEAERLLSKDLLYYNSQSWWLGSQGATRHCASYVDYDGDICRSGDFVNQYNVIRPVLLINIDSSDFKVGDTFQLANLEFKILTESLAFCLGDIGSSSYRDDWNAVDATDYMKSNAKVLIDNWFNGIKR